eukprot:364902-Chlamydomonas_euryale.AAC.30
MRARRPGYGQPNIHTRLADEDQSLFVTDRQMGPYVYPTPADASRARAPAATREMPPALILLKREAGLYIQR